MAVVLEQFKYTESADGSSLENAALDAGASAGNLLVTTASARWGAGGPVGTFTPPDGYGASPDFEISPMEAHTAALAHKEAAGSETVATWTSTGTRSCCAVGLYEFSGITDPVLDKTSEDGSGATSVSSINTNSTGTLGASAGVAFLIGLDRTGTGAAHLSNDASMTETHDTFVNGATVAYWEVHAWQEFSASTAYDVTVTSTGSSRMGAGIATFIADAGGGGSAIAPISAYYRMMGMR